MNDLTPPTPCQSCASSLAACLARTRAGRPPCCSSCQHEDYDARDPHGLHDYDDPESELHRVETISLATERLCQHCSATATLLPMAGTGWGLDVQHEPHCSVTLDSEW